MSAWKKGLGGAPKDAQVLVRLPEWDCPAIMKHEQEHGADGWAFCEQLLGDVAGWLEPDEESRAEWALIPQ